MGTLPAALAAAEGDFGLICPKACGQEAAWVGACQVTAPPTLLATMNHLNGKAILPGAEPGRIDTSSSVEDLRDVKGQERARRALEISAAGRHHYLMIGAPGSGKSMMARRLPGILPELTPEEALETSMVHSVAGLLGKGGISYERPFMSPHHTASMPAIVGGGRNAKPGEISLAHHGVLFMDEFPEFPRQVLETLRQPLETGDVVISRANAHVRYPCKFLLVAAANPCRCGYLPDPERACARVPICGEEYLGRISGPLMDRFDLRIEVPPVSMSDLREDRPVEDSKTVAKRVQKARDIQTKRYENHPDVRVNADVDGEALKEVAIPDTDGMELLHKVAEKYRLSARGYHRILRVARTIADLDGSDTVRRPHVAEATAYRVTYMN